MPLYIQFSGPILSNRFASFPQAYRTVTNWALCLVSPSMIVREYRRGGNTFLCPPLSESLTLCLACLGENPVGIPLRGESMRKPQELAYDFFLHIRERGFAVNSPKTYFIKASLSTAELIRTTAQQL